MSNGRPSSEGPGIGDFLPLINGGCSGLLGATAIFNFATGNNVAGAVNAGLSAMWLGIGVLNTYNNHRHHTP